MLNSLSPRQTWLEGYFTLRKKKTYMRNNLACCWSYSSAQSNPKLTRLAKYSQELYWDLEKETGVVTGFKRNGSMTVALTEERLEELNRQADMARAYDVEIENIDKAEIKSRYPHLNTEDVLGGLWLPKDGQADPCLLYTSDAADE